MAQTTSRVFKSGNSLAVRLPREVALDCGTEVTIVRSGNVLTIRPKKQDLKWLAERLRTLPRPSKIEERDVEEIPEREGL